MNQIIVNFMKDFRNHIEENSKNLGFNVLYGNIEEGYFIVENKEGYRAYLQASSFNRGIDVSMKYAPSKKMGTGKSMYEALPLDTTLLIDRINVTLEKAKGYPKDTRQPKSAFASHI